MVTEQLRGTTPAPVQQPDTWLAKVLSKPGAIDKGAWDVLQPTKPANAEEKSALEKEIEIGGITIPVYEVRKQILIEIMESTALRLLVSLNDPEKIKKATL